MTKLDQEEQEILDAFESGNLKPSKSAKQIQKQHQSYAETMVKKDSRINFLNIKAHHSQRSKES